MPGAQRPLLTPALMVTTGAQDDPQPTDEEAALARALGRRLADVAARLAR